MTAVTKPLGIKAYGHIPHLPGSRIGEGDHHCHEGQAIICCKRTRDRHDRIIVQEKLDGSCVAVARIEGQIVPLVRAGYPAFSSPYKQHALFAKWALERADRFATVLNDGERLVGEWLALAHGTRYDLTGREPFVAFDLMAGTKRLCVSEFMVRTGPGGFATPPILHDGGPFTIDEAVKSISKSYYGALDPVEGAVWRVERNGKVDFLAKYVRPDKKDGCFLSCETGGEETWNWTPRSAPQ